MQAPTGCAFPTFSFFCFSLWLLLHCHRPHAHAAVDHPVLWTLGANYDTSGKSFAVGDTITFSWFGDHDVVEVSDTDYEACKTSPSDTKFTTSPAKVSLTEAGTRYFICSYPGHCNTGGMKMSVTVAMASASAATAPSSSLPFSPSPSPSPSSSSSSSSSSPPSSSFSPPSPSFPSTPPPTSSPSNQNSTSTSGSCLTCNLSPFLIIAALPYFLLLLLPHLNL